MDSKYVVEVSSPAETAGPETREQLGLALKLSEARVEALIRRLPDVVTRPLPRNAAEAVAGRFRSAGLEARIVSAGTDPVPAPRQRPATQSAPTLFEAPPPASGAAAGPEGAGDGNAPAPAVRAGTGVWLETDTPPQGSTSAAAAPPAPAAEPGRAAPAGETSAAGPAADTDSPVDSADSAYEAISPAELLARLRGDSADPDAAAVLPDTAPATETPSAGARKLQGRLRGKILELAAAPALFTLIGALGGGWYAWNAADPSAGFVAFLRSDSFMAALAGGGTLFVIGFLFAGRRARALTRNVQRLTDRADAVSRGELEGSMEFESGDELEQLAEAIERMRVGMRGAFERLRGSRRP